MTPTLYDEALTYLRQRETSTYSAYDAVIKQLVANWTLDDWHLARDLHEVWRHARIDAARADKAQPCTHTTAERSHEAQRCGCCWTISTYIRLSEPKENDDD